MDVDPGLSDPERLAAFVAAGHTPLTYDSGGRATVDLWWVDAERPGDTHVGLQCVSCGWRHCEACDGEVAIPPCDGAFGLARRLRERAVAAWLRAGVAESDAGEAERRALAILLTSEPAIMGGRRVFRGTRVPLDAVANNLGDLSLDGVLAEFPTLDRADVEAVLSILPRASRRAVRLLDLSEAEVEAIRTAVIDEGIPYDLADVPDKPAPSFADHLLASPGGLSQLPDRSPILLEAAHRIVAATGALSVWRAPRPDGDWDMAVVLPDDVEPGRWNPVTLWHLVSDLGIGLTVALTESVYERDRLRVDVKPLAWDISVNGVRLV